MVICADAITVYGKFQRPVRIACKRMLPIIQIIPIALRDVVSQIASQFQTVFEIAHLQKQHFRTAFNIFGTHAVWVVLAEQIQ